MKLSIVIPVYNEEEIIPILKDRIEKVILSLDCVFEVIVVSDGSSDRTAQLVKDWVLTNPAVILLELSRNFGHQAAITAGLKESTGDAVVILDADLQDPPELIPEMLKKWQEGARVVLAQRRSRHDPFVRRIFFKIFYGVFEMLTDISPVTTGVFGLLDRVAVNHLLALGEHNRYIPGLRQWIGFSQATVLYDRQPRVKGQPRQSFARLIKYGLDAIFSFSYKPLRLSFIVGLIISLSCILYAITLLILRLLGINVVQGFTTVAVAILFLSGVVLISNGIIGEYIGRIYDEVKRRPLFIVAQKTCFDTQRGQIRTEGH